MEEANHTGDVARALALRAHHVRSAPQQIVAAIRESILDGSLRPGDRLPSEEELADLFGVSRPTVRAGLRQLRGASVLSARRGRNGGHRVADLSLDTLSTSVADGISISIGDRSLGYAQLFELREALEVLAAGAAAQRRTEDDLAALEAVVHRAAAPPDGPQRVFDVDMEFHRRLAESTHNPLIVSFVGATVTAFRPFSVQVHRAPDDRVVAHLDEVVAGVRARDVAAATAAMRRHLSYSTEYFAAQRDQEGGAAPSP